MLKEQLRKLACEEENKTIIITYLIHRPVFLNNYCSSKIINYTVGVLTATIFFGVQVKNWYSTATKSIGVEYQFFTCPPKGIVTTVVIIYYFHDLCLLIIKRLEFFSHLRLTPVLHK